MLALVVDTAGSTGGVLLARYDGGAKKPGETEVLGKSALPPREFSTQLISAIAELLQANQLALPAVDAFAVVSGPGSFTGLRVGLSAIKAMAEVTAKPVIAVSRLAIMASMGEGFDGLVHAVLDAGRGEFYHGAYRDAGEEYVAESLETLGNLATTFNRGPGLVVASEPNVLAALSALPSVAPCQIPYATVREALPLVLTAWQARRFTDVALLDANYLHRINPGIVSKAAGSPKPADTRADRT
jgi:tRNA threonylcarbamoyladenosine biosynthesis protein TsaB